MLPMAPAVRHNARELYADVFWYGTLAGSALAFLSVYAAHIDATSFQIGLITAGPAVVNLLFSLPAGHWLEQRSPARAAFTTSLWHRVGYLFLIPLPVLLPPAAQVWALPLIILLMSLPGTALAIAFNALFAEAVPPEWRAHVVGRRNALLALNTTLTSLACGWLLDKIAFPLNYQIVFGIGALGAGLSSYYLGRIRLPSVPAPQVNRPLNGAPRPSVSLFRLDLLRGPFGPFLGAYFLFYTAQFLTIPLMPLAWVNELHLTDGAISFGNAIFWLIMFIASLGLARLTRRFGNRSLLIVGATLYGLYPFFHAIAKDATLFWVASFIGGAVWAMTNGSLLNRLMERVPDGDRPAHMALHNLALNFGILLGSFLGPALAEWLGLRNAMLLGAILRALAGLLMGVWG